MDNGHASPDRKRESSSERVDSTKKDSLESPVKVKTSESIPINGTKRHEEKEEGTSAKKIRLEENDLDDLQGVRAILQHQLVNKEYMDDQPEDGEVDHEEHIQNMIEARKALKERVKGDQHSRSPSPESKSSKSEAKKLRSADSSKSKSETKHSTQKRDRHLRASNGHAESERVESKRDSPRYKSPSRSEKKEERRRSRSPREAQRKRSPRDDRRREEKREERRDDKRDSRRDDRRDTRRDEKRDDRREDRRDDRRDDRERRVDRRDDYRGDRRPERKSYDDRRPDRDVRSVPNHPILHDTIVSSVQLVVLDVSFSPVCGKQMLWLERAQK